MSEAQSDIVGAESVYGNIWVREIVYVNKGDVKSGHKHEFDHLHYLVKGSVRLETIDENDVVLDSQDYTAPSWIKVPKEVFHRMTALEDMTVGNCIQAMRDEDGIIMDTDYERDLAQDTESQKPLEFKL